MAKANREASPKREELLKGVRHVINRIYERSPKFARILGWMEMEFDCRGKAARVARTTWSAIAIVLDGGFG
jgi:hypothetical protein